MGSQIDLSKKLKQRKCKYKEIRALKASKPKEKSKLLKVFKILEKKYSNVLIGFYFVFSLGPFRR